MHAFTCGNRGVYVNVGLHTHTLNYSRYRAKVFYIWHKQDTLMGIKIHVCVLCVKLVFHHRTALTKQTKSYILNIDHRNTCHTLATSYSLKFWVLKFKFLVQLVVTLSDSNSFLLGHIMVLLYLIITVLKPGDYFWFKIRR